MIGPADLIHDLFCVGQLIETLVGRSQMKYGFDAMIGMPGRTLQMRQGISGAVLTRVDVRQILARLVVVWLEGYRSFKVAFGTNSIARIHAGGCQVCPEIRVVWLQLDGTGEMLDGTIQLPQGNSGAADAILIFPNGWREICRLDEGIERRLGPSTVQLDDSLRIQRLGIVGILRKQGLNDRLSPLQISGMIRGDRLSQAFSSGHWDNSLLIVYRLRVNRSYQARAVKRWENGALRKIRTFGLPLTKGVLYP